MAAGREKVEISVVEEIRAVLYGRDDVPDVCTVQGHIHAEAPLQGVPEVTVPLSRTHRVRDMRLHECCSAPDSSRPASIAFSPPVAPFTLCRYDVEAPSVDELPVVGRYSVEVLPGRRVRIDLVLAPSPHVATRRVERCAAQLPLPHMGAVASHSVQASTGKVSVVPDSPTAGALLVWEPGSAFCARGKRATLRGTVCFAGGSTAPGPHAGDGPARPGRAAPIGWREHQGFCADGEYSLRAAAKQRPAGSSGEPAAGASAPAAPIVARLRDAAGLDVVGAVPSSAAMGAEGARGAGAQGVDGRGASPDPAPTSLLSMVMMRPPEEQGAAADDSRPASRASGRSSGEWAPDGTAEAGGVGESSAGPSSRQHRSDLGMDLSVDPSVAKEWLRRHPSKVRARRVQWHLCPPACPLLTAAPRSSWRSGPLWRTRFWWRATRSSASTSRLWTPPSAGLTSTRRAWRCTQPPPPTWQSCAASLQRTLSYGAAWAPPRRRARRPA